MFFNWMNNYSYNNQVIYSNSLLQRHKEVLIFRNLNIMIYISRNSLQVVLVPLHIPLIMYQSAN